MLKLTLGLLALPAFAAEPSSPPPGAALVMRIEWKGEALPPGSEVKREDDRLFLSIKQTTAAPVTLALWHKSDPGIRTKCYALRGTICYSDVEGTGYLELWSQFPGTPAPASYFSRTLADAGPMKKISGTSAWRTIWIPFDATQSATLPQKLNLNLVLPSTGSVNVSDLELYQFSDAGAMWAALNGSDAGGTEITPSPSSRRKWHYGIIGAVAAGFSVLSALALSMRRRQAERRRMRAMDRR